MKKPILFLLDDDQQVLLAISRDLRAGFGKDFRIVQNMNTSDALDNLTDLKNAAFDVALFLCDQRMPGMDGVSFLKKAAALFPQAKRVLLTAYSDTNAAIRAINDIRLDYYLLKPWDPPEEKLFPVLRDLLEEWQRDHRPAYQGIRVIGYQYAPESHKIKDYLGSSLVPFQWLDVDGNRNALDLLSANQISEAQLPVIFFEDGTFASRPDITALAAKLQISMVPTNDIYDVVIVGAGPAGLAAAVYGASEGLKTLLIERKAPGGQAGTSSRIENYLGFPSGLSGADLTRRAVTQATRLGAEVIAPCTVCDIRQENGYKITKLEDGRTIVSRSIIVTTGVDYRRLDVPGIDQLTGAGVYYGASATEAGACKGKNVYILGGGNSAGQSAVYLSNYAAHVYIVIRGIDLQRTMSAYLIDQIAQISNIQLITETEVTGVTGEGRLQAITLRNRLTAVETKAVAAALYIFIGAKPYTDWLGAGIIRNEKGFIETGRDLRANPSFSSTWNQTREPYLLETACQGIFAAGDVRAGSMARVASAVGEGSMAISFVHQYLIDG